MTGPIERRLEALESRATAVSRSLRVVIAKVGETPEQAKQREGIEPGAELIIIVTFGD